MDDSTNANTRNGGINMTSAESHLGEQPLPNDTMKRTTERTCTRKRTIPTLEKQDYTNANMRWRKCSKYLKMIKDRDVSTMTNNKKILPPYGDQLETEIKDIILWAIGQNAVTEMTKRSKRERERAELTIVVQTIHIHYIFRLHFTPERNVQYSRAKFFNLKLED